jgi:hypothetical protein
MRSSLASAALAGRGEDAAIDRAVPARAPRPRRPFAFGGAWGTAPPRPRGCSGATSRTGSRSPRAAYTQRRGLPDRLGTRTGGGRRRPRRARGVPGRGARGADGASCGIWRASSSRPIEGEPPASVNARIQTEVNRMAKAEGLAPGALASYGQEELPSARPRSARSSGGSSRRSGGSPPGSASSAARHGEPRHPGGGPSSARPGPSSGATSRSSSTGSTPPGRCRRWGPCPTSRTSTPCSGSSSSEGPRRWSRSRHDGARHRRGAGSQGRGDGPAHGGSARHRGRHGVRWWARGQRRLPERHRPRRGTRKPPPTPRSSIRGSRWRWRKRPPPRSS